MLWPSLAFGAVIYGPYREEMAVELATAHTLEDGGSDAIRIADVRRVPLDQLGADADARRLVDLEQADQEKPSSIKVAMFSSSI